MVVREVPEVDPIVVVWSVALLAKPQVVPVPAPHCTATFEPALVPPTVTVPPVPWSSWIAVEPVPPLISAVELPTTEPILTRLVPVPVGVPVAILTVLPPATVVGSVAMLIVSTKPLPVPVVLPMLIFRAAAGLILPSPMVVTRVLLPRASDAVPAVPEPDKMFTAVVAAVAPFSILTVSPAVDWPRMMVLVLLV